jgi:hypothetical protein
MDHGNFMNKKQLKESWIGIVLEWDWMNQGLRFELGKLEA